MTKSDLHIVPTRKSRRILASLIDTCIALVWFVLISSPTILICINNVSTPNVITALSIALIALLTGSLATLGVLVYEVFLPYVWNGQSIGMRLLKIKIIDEKGEDLKLRQLIVRAMTVVFLFVTTAGICLLAEIFIVALGKDNRSFNDTVTRIYVVDKELLIEGD